MRRKEEESGESRSKRRRRKRKRGEGEDGLDEHKIGRTEKYNFEIELK